MRAQGHRVGRKRVMRLMRAEGLRARRPRRFRVTTVSAPSWQIAPNRLQRCFTASAPNQVWAADLTYLETDEGWLYLAVILDLYSRRVVGWAARPTLHTELACAALHLALGRRQPAPGLVHHSDQGWQYASDAYQRLLAAHGIIPSMSRRGNCWDNAVLESFFSTLKQETDRSRWSSHRVATRDLTDFIDGFYNPVRLHSTIGYQAPNMFEATART